MPRTVALLLSRACPNQVAPGNETEPQNGDRVKQKTGLSKGGDMDVPTFSGPLPFYVFKSSPKRVPTPRKTPKKGNFASEIPAFGLVRSLFSCRVVWRLFGNRWRFLAVTLF